jgi:hypothetical protein
MEILPSSYAKGSITKYILYTKINGVPLLYYTYKIDLNHKITELNKYVDGNIESVHKIDFIVPFNIKKPLDSIEKFYKILILQSG